MRIKKTIKTFFSRLFHAKKVIIVSDAAVDCYPMGRLSQLAVLLGVVGVVSWGSYSTGSYMAAQSSLEAKSKEVEQAEEATRSIESQFSLLKRDLVSLQQEEKDLSEYAKFVIAQYEEDPEYDGHTAMGAEIAKQQELVMQRINFLEERIEQLKDENDAFVSAVKERTQDKIKEFEDIISMTGLPLQSLEVEQVKRDKKAKSNDEMPQGGPYEPENLFEHLDDGLFQNIDEMVMLRDIIDGLPLAKPMKGKFTSGFGHRRDPFTGRPALHSGLDIAAPRGQEVTASANGKVTIAERRGSYGLLVEIDHGLGVTTRYSHLSRIDVEKGHRIRKGETLGVQGSTGRSTGHHLHYEVRHNGGSD